MRGRHSTCYALLTILALLCLLLGAMPAAAQVQAWGQNAHGQLGGGPLAVNSTPLYASGPMMAKAVAAGYQHTLSVRVDGTVWAWGRNNYGQLGIAGPAFLPVPAQVSALNTVRAKAVAAGQEFGVALTPLGTVYAWGRNNMGQLGDNSLTNHTVPAPISTNAYSGGTFKEVSAGKDFVLALRSDGTVWGWGNNSVGQLGQGVGAPTSSKIPVQVPGLQNVIAIAAGYSHSLALKGDGTVWAWGWNNAGQLGVAPSSPKLTAAPVPGLSHIKAISAGISHSLALHVTGTISAWGDNAFGQLGDNFAPQDRFTPGPVANLFNVQSISAGGNSGLALLADGTVWGWGANTTGQLGNGNTTNQPLPVQAGVGNQVNFIVGIAAGTFHTAVVRSRWQVRAWGDNVDGQLGDNTLTDRLTPITMLPILGVKDVKAGGFHSLALLANGTVWACGDGGVGQLGNGGSGAQSFAAPVRDSTGQLLENIIAIAAGAAHTLALRADGTVWACGRNDFGQIGDATIFYRFFAVQIFGADRFKTIGAGAFHSLAIRGDGRAMAWGNNVDGQLGDATYNSSNVPVQVAGAPYMVSVAGGDNHSLGSVASGMAFGWGDDTQGQLGDNYAAAPSINFPVQVFGISGITSVASGAYHGMAMNSVGRLFCWGYGFYGQLGDNGTNNDPVPIQAGGVIDAVVMGGGWFHSLAGLATGYADAWGRNNQGQIGDGSTTNRLLKVPVLNLKHVLAIDGGEGHSLAVSLVNTAPKAHIAPVPVVSTTGTTAQVPLDGSGSTDPEGDPLTYEWTRLGTGVIATGVKPIVTLPVGTHVIRLKVTDPDGLFDFVDADVVVKQVIPTKLKVTSVVGDYGSTATLKATLTDVNGALANKTVAFFIDGSAVGTAVTTSAGLASLPHVLTETLGTHSLRADYAGDSVYLASTHTGTLTVNRAVTKVTVSALTVKYGAPITVKATLFAGRNALAGRRMSVRVNGTDMGSGDTDASGLMALLLPAQFVPDVGTYQVVFSFEGEANYHPSTGENVLTVVAAPTKTTAANLKARAGTNVNYTAKLISSVNGSPLPNQSIQFIDSVTGASIGSAVTNSLGVAAIQIVAPAAGTTRKITAKFWAIGIPNYLASQSTGGITGT